jgi:lipopolysaccharide export system permease protein
MFIFVVQYAFTQMDMFIGKGLTAWDITKLLFYLGLDVVRLVLPLTILLSAIMTFGGFGERSELAAMKSAGISLVRIMFPLFGFVIVMSVGLYYFSDVVLPGNQKRARNMLYNIARTRPALSFEEGIFSKSVPSFSIKIDKKSGDDDRNWEKVFIHKNAEAFQDQQTILAEKGLIVPSPDNHYLKLELYDGFIYQDDVNSKDFNTRKRQQATAVKFDTLVQHLDISELIKTSLDKESGGDSYRYRSYAELTPYIDSTQKSNASYYKDITKREFFTLVSEPEKLDSLNYNDYEESFPYDWSEQDGDAKVQLVRNAVKQVNMDKNNLEGRGQEIKAAGKFFSKMVIWQQHIIAYSVTCLVFFLIGAPLGSIIRKGGVGMPVVVAIIIFIIFYIISLYMENLSKNLILNTYWASWLPNILLFPLGIYFTIQSMRDSDIFNIDIYLDPVKKFFGRFVKSKNTEHSRYQ